jgi:hypothetical protein
MHIGFCSESQKKKKERPLGRAKRRLEDNIKTDLREQGWSGTDWINLA